MLDKFLIGNYTDEIGKTGVTAIIAKDGAVGGCSVRGGAPATHETDLLKSENTVEKINAVVLSGGSAFGLESISGVMQFLHENNIGYNAGKYVVPICVGASIYDLEFGAFSYPDKQAGYLAAKTATPVSDYNGYIGAGAGATICKRGGMASAKKSGMAVVTGKKGDIEVAVVVTVNAFGDIYDPITGNCLKSSQTINESSVSGNTTIACVLTNVKMTKAQANKIADTTHDAYAICIRPVHTIKDGDTVFVMTSGEVEASLVDLQLLVEDVCCKAIIAATTVED